MSSREQGGTDDHWDFNAVSPGKNGYNRCDQHGYGKVEAADQSKVYGICIWKEVLGQIMR